jgi:hypothetical protein
MNLISFELYFKMLIPIFDIFTNTTYDVIGLMWFGRLFGICIKTKYNYVIAKYSIVNLPEYHLKTDTIAQFYKK